jgi:hypothetical protein
MHAIGVGHQADCAMLSHHTKLGVAQTLAFLRLAAESRARSLDCKAELARDGETQVEFFV